MRRWSLAAIAALVILPGSLAVRADDDVYHKIFYVRVGDPAPEFECKDDQGKVWRSKDHVGRKVIVVVFYMGDYFPNCTKQLTGYRDYQKYFTSLGAEVVGVSGDLVENHEKFKKEYRINFALLADSENKVGEGFGVYPSSGGFTRGKDSAGKDIRLQRGVTMKRWTFVIGRDGKVIYKDTQPGPKDDARRVFEALGRMSGPK